MATDFTQAMRGKARELSVRGEIICASGVKIALTGEEIVRYVVREGVSDGALPGAVLSASHTLELANAQGEWLEGGAKLNGQVLAGATVRLELGVKLESGAWEYRALGVFVVSDAAGGEGDARIALTGSDSAASEMYAQFKDTLTYPAALEAVWRHALAQTRYVWNGTVPNGNAVIGKKPDWKGGSVRQALAAAAMAAGCFVRISRDGALELVKCFDASASAAELDAETYLKMTHSARVFGPVQALTIAPMRAEGEDEDPAEITVRTDASAAAGSGNTVKIANNPLFVGGASGLNQLMQGTLDQLAGMRLQAMEARWRGDPEIRVGDRVKITDRRGNVTETTVLRQVLTFEGGFSAEIGCDVAEADNSGLPRAITPEGGVNAQALVGTVDGRLLAAESVTARSIAAGTVTAEKIAAGAVGAEKIEAGAVTAEKLDAKSVDAHVINAVTAHLEKVIAGEITADELYAAIAEIAQLDVGEMQVDGAQIIDASIVGAKIADAAVTSAKIGDAAVGTAQIALGAITTALIKAGAVGTAQIADGSITDAKIVNLTADKINAGTLSAERLLLKGANGLFYEINAQAGGLTGTQLTEEQYKNAISGTALAARSVTADKIAAKSLTANEIAAGSITAAEIDVAQFFAAEGVVNSLQAVDISGNESLRLYVKDHTAEWSDAPPEAPEEGCIWGDTGVSPPLLRRWRGADLPADREISAAYEGGRIVIDNGAGWAAAADVEAAFFPAQAGSGEASPDNIRAIRAPEALRVTAVSPAGESAVGCSFGMPVCAAEVDFAAGRWREVWRLLTLTGAEDWSGAAGASGNWVGRLRIDSPAAYEEGGAICSAARSAAEEEISASAAGGVAVSPGTPVVTAHPQDAIEQLGGTATFAVAARGADISYQWQWQGIDSGEWWGDSGLASAKNAVLEVPVTADRGGQSYRCLVTDAKGRTAASEAATLTVGDAADPDFFAVVGQPKNRIAPLGGVATFAVTVQGAGLSYQWQWRSANGGAWGDSGLPGAKSAVLEVPVTADRDGQSYRCLVTDEKSRVAASRGAVLRIGEEETEPECVVLSFAGVADKGGFETFLAGRFAAGEPVTVAYRLEAPEEHVFAPQTLAILPGENVLHTEADGLRAVVHGSGWETVNDQAALKEYAETRFEQTDEQIRMRVIAGDLEVYLRMEADGVHIGRVGDMYSARINGTSFDILAGGNAVASFRDGQIRLGTYDFRETSDAGMAFTKWRS